MWEPIQSVFVFGLIGGFVRLYYNFFKFSIVFFSNFTDPQELAAVVPRSWRSEPGEPVWLQEPGKKFIVFTFFFLKLRRK